MDLNKNVNLEKKSTKSKVATGVGFTAVLGGVATIVGILANVSDIFGNLSGKKPEAERPDLSIEYEYDGNDGQDDAISIGYEDDDDDVPPVPVSTKKKLRDMTPAEYLLYYPDESSAEDTLGNTYYGNVTYFMSGWSSSGGELQHAQYYLGGQYKVAKGTIAVECKSANSEKTYLSFYGDDETIFVQNDLCRTFAPTEVTFSVENIQWLTIENANYQVGPILYNWVFE